MPMFWCCPYLHGAISCFILQGHAQVNFVSTLLRVTMSDQLDLPVRQAGKCEHMVPRNQ